jgi:hypothetical protein
MANAPVLLLVLQSTAVAMPWGGGAGPPCPTRAARRKNSRRLSLAARTLPGLRSASSEAPSCTGRYVRVLCSTEPAFFRAPLA